jgi:hypothetical protein
MDDGFRGPLIVLEVLALAVILAFVDDTRVRVALGLLIALLLARGALTAGREPTGAGAPITSSATG